MDIRRLTGQDGQAFWELRLRALEREPFAFGEAAEEHRARPLKSFVERFDAAADDQFVLGAFSSGQLVGTAGFYRYQAQKERHKGRVWGVYVAEEFRGHGVARALMTELLARARRVPGLERVVLTVSVKQPAAKRLYASLGFESYGREPRALQVGGEFVDDIYMVLPLSEP